MSPMTVVIPAFGDTPELREAVASVLGQDSDDWTLLVLDDGPPDGALAGWFGGLDPRVRYQHNPNRLGINRNFQQALDLASGDLLVMLGADDRLLPSYVRVMGAAAAAHPAAAWLHPGVQVIDERGAVCRPLADRVKARLSVREPGLHGGQELAASLLRGNWMYFPAITFRAETARRHGFRPGYEIVLDLDLYLRLLLAGESAVLVPTVCFQYRRHRASLSSEQRTTGQRFDEEQQYFLAQARLLDEFGWPRAARAARWHVSSRLHALTVLPGVLRDRRWDAAGGLLGHALTPPPVS
ncbi:MAG TPA: glycosyltransferase family 2 protein [Candidatus Nanopelagicales bacterium]|nr:glycosyltransferase family 2 protein [Candidatus Nanopelagicales bacterium]